MMGRDRLLDRRRGRGHTSIVSATVTMLRMPAGPNPVAIAFAVVGTGDADRAQEPVIFIVDSGGEVKRVLVGAARAVTEGNAPDADVGDWVAGGVGELAEELA